jgi:TonB family protein
MTDPVSEELARRAHLDLPWRRALLAAVGLHLAVAATVLLAPTHRQRALSLPAVQIRLSAPPLSVAGAAKRTSAAEPPATPIPKATSRKAAEAPPRHPLPARTPVRAAPAESAPQIAAPAPGPAGQAAGAPAGIALGVGEGGGEESFPFTYYLNRVLALIESNWFRPPALPDTHCRVRCVIDRSGRLLEAGLEQPSTSASFDRAALRAVYAAAPLPPLPQGFSGTTLTLHLEFGP